MTPTAAAHAPLVVVGDSLLDKDIAGRSERMCPDSDSAPVIDVESSVSRPGGAALAALMSASDGVPTTLVTPLADDADGRALRDRLQSAGVRVVAVGHEGGTRVKARVRAHGTTVARMDSGGTGRPLGPVGRRLVSALDGAAGVLLSCYGGGVSRHPEVRDVLTAWLWQGRPLVWDPHPRGGDPVPGCTLLTPNLPEAQSRSRTTNGERHRQRRRPPTAATLAARLRREWSATAVAVTAGAEGAWLGLDDGVHHIPCAAAADGDTCGAGDRFAATAAAALAEGRTPLEATRLAVSAATTFVAAGGVAGMRVAGDHEPRPTVVATGGCFDVFHAGHLHLLDQARRLGDRLVVLVNSDRSVSRLKGSGRPVHRVEDRIRVLRGLSCVDSVVVFDEDDPREALRRIRPDVWVKGGDYTADRLPEADLVRSWGGRVVILPVLNGRSTTAALHALNGAAG
jgi:D-beta-D-heptose 7-phosphate kinase/D-beta-D-heptose 1-phosphate adenosyltransferase